MQGTLSTSREDMFTDLVCALLTVNNWNLDKISAILPGLRAQRLVAPQHVRGMNVYEVAGALEEAGYRRGDFMIGLLARRVLSAAELLSRDDVFFQLHECEEHCDTERMRAILTSINGVGPAVLNVYLQLRGLKKTPGGTDRQGR